MSKKSLPAANSRTAAAKIRKVLTTAGLAYPTTGKTVSFSGFGHGDSCFVTVEATAPLSDAMQARLRRACFDLAATPYFLGGGLAIINLTGPAYGTGGSLGRKEHVEPDAQPLREFIRSHGELANQLDLLWHDALNHSELLRPLFQIYHGQAYGSAIKTGVDLMAEEAPNLAAPKLASLKRTLDNFQAQLTQILESGELLRELETSPVLRPRLQAMHATIPGRFEEEATKWQASLSELLTDHCGPASSRLQAAINAAV